jgi:hypothetical protein
MCICRYFRISLDENMTVLNIRLKHSVLFLRGPKYNNHLESIPMTELIV